MVAILLETKAHHHERITSGSVLYPAHTGKVPESDLRISPVPGGEYHLPGYGEPYDSCGAVKFKIVCADCGSTTLALHHCDRKECPTCYTTWSNRRARVATQKLESGFKQMGGRYRPRHVVVSLPASTWGMSYNDVLKLALGLIHRYTRGSYGGTSIGHPWRFEDSQGEALQWKHCDLNREAIAPIFEGYAVYRPHVHFIMFGWIAPSEEIYRDTGVVIHTIAMLPTEQDVFSCIRYQLTHCGVDQTHHAIRWFGNMSYNNFVKVSESTETIYPRCEVCDGELWAYSLDGKLLGRHSLEVTRYHYLFKPKQKTLVPQKRIKKHRSLESVRHKGRSSGDQILNELFARFKALSG